MTPTDYEELMEDETDITLLSPEMDKEEIEEYAKLLGMKPHPVDVI